MEYGKITEKIIGCAFKVYNILGFGFLESVYENSLVVELEKAEIDFVQQEPITVIYEETIVGDFIADLIVEDKIIIELKSVTRLCEKHEVQLVNYLKSTEKPIGLLINFGENKVEVKRKYKDVKAIFS